MSNTSLKLKTLWLSFFQPQNTFLIQKSMKSTPLDATTSLNSDENASSSGASSAGGVAVGGNSEYRRLRDRNNESVRKSRAKQRMMLEECATHVQELKRENVQLNTQLNGLQQELVTLKSLFQHCFSFNLNSLSIKPSDIPTSTLYKIIMKKDLPGGEPTTNMVVAANPTK